MGIIRERTRGRGVPDEISEVVGETIYAERAYFRDLRDQVLGTHSTDLIGVSRHYFTRTPQLVVDFEPAPPDKFYVDEKRRYFMQKGIVYVPIFLREILTRERFADRVKAETSAMTSGDGERQLHRVEVEEWMQEPETLKVIERHAAHRAEQMRQVRQTNGKATPPALFHRLLRQAKQDVTQEFREAAKRGKLGYYLRRLQSPELVGR